MKSKWSLVLATALLALAALPAQGQTTIAEAPGEQGEVTSYPPSFFAPYSPTTASGMVSRIPGFDVDGGDDARGLAGAAGNVLIDGQRPPGKSDIWDILERLRANQVAQIDLIRGGAPGIDMQGKQMVINIIRMPQTGGYTGAVEVGGAHIPTVDRQDNWIELTGVRELASGARFDGELSYTRASGETGAPGTQRLRTDAAGAVINTVSNESDDFWENISARTSAEFRPFGGEAKLTGRLNRSESNRQAIERFNGSPRLTDSQGEDNGGEVEASYAYALSGDGRMQAVVSKNWSEDRSSSRSLSGRPPTGYGSTENGGKIDASIEYPLGRGVRLQSIFAKSWEKESSTSSSIRSGGTLSSETNDEETGETALRTTVFFPAGEAFSFESGAEAAYNLLEGSSDISLGGVSVPIPGSQAKVDEKRAEAFTVATWRIGPSLTLEGFIRHEFSTLSAAGVRKPLSFTKPMVQATWRIEPQQQLIARLERTVGQLDFGDFLSSASISEFDEFITAGAVDLTPTQTWVSSLQFDQQFWDTGTLRLRGEYRALTDVIDTRPVVTPNGAFEATGNIGGGRQGYFNAEVDAPLDRVGIAGGRLKLDGHLLLLSEMTDPFTREKRRFGWDTDYRLSANFEHDIRSWKSTWGFSASTQADRASYRSNSIEVSEQTPDFSAFAIYRPGRTSLIRLDLRNIALGHSGSRRQVHTGQRDLTPVSYIETRRNDRLRSLRLTYRRSIG